MVDGVIKYIFYLVNDNDFFGVVVFNGSKVVI